jgi:hypothetical protein
MATFQGGSDVESGCYMNVQNLALVWLPAKGKLPGGVQERFARIPMSLVFLAAPVVGGLYVVAMPVAGAAMLAWSLARRVVSAAGAGARDLAAAMPPPHAVGEAHLTGKPGEGKPVSDAKIEALDAEIQERREDPPKSP